MKFHLSPIVGDWLECRAKPDSCPYGDHGDMGDIVQRAVALAAKGEPCPGLKATGGTHRAVEVQEDGTVRVGTRLFTATGERVVSATTARTRAYRARQREEASAQEPANPSRQKHPATAAL